MLLASRLGDFWLEYDDVLVRDDVFGHWVLGLEKIVVLKYQKFRSLLGVWSRGFVVVIESEGVECRGGYIIVLGGGNLFYFS